VTTDEVLAAQWLRDNTSPDDVAATNVHCFDKQTKDRCMARSYWLPALSERRYVVESWAYTEETLVQIGQQTGGFAAFPFDDPALLALNDSAFTAPTAEILARLRDEHGVRWLYADLGAGPVSPELDSLATLRFSNGHARVYELKR
jgi:hypothetical protein